jgi:filamentous hemagglutinin
MHYLYGKDIQVNDLTADQKSTISAIVGLGGAAIGATGGAADVTQGSMAAVNAVENNRLTPEDRAKLNNAKAECKRTGNNTACKVAERLESLDSLTDLLDEPGLGRDGALVKNALDEALPLVKGTALDTIVGDGKGGVMRGGVYVAVDFLMPGGAVELAGTLVGGKLILVAGELYLMSGAGKVIGRVSASAEKAVRQALNIAKPGVKAELGVVNAGKPIIKENGFYSVDGMKISTKYYDRLWEQGRPAPFLQAREILNSNPKISPDPRGAVGYFKYESSGLEMIFNPKTGQIGHIQPIRNK